MNKVKGIIQWLPEKPVEFPKGSGDYNIGLKINKTFYNLYKDKETLKNILKELKKGYEVELDVEGNAIKSFEILSREIKSSEDMTNFEDLLTQAHKEFEHFSITTELIDNDWENKRALCKAKITILKSAKVESAKVDNTEEYVETSQFFEAHGDATQENCGEMVQKHWIRMAETRAIVRALRLATNNAKTATEETETEDIPVEKITA